MAFSLIYCSGTHYIQHLFVKGLDLAHDFMGNTWTCWVLKKSLRRTWYCYFGKFCLIFLVNWRKRFNKWISRFSSQYRSYNKWFLLLWFQSALSCHRVKLYPSDLVISFLKITDFRQISSINYFFPKNLIIYFFSLN